MTRADAGIQAIGAIIIVAAAWFATIYAIPAHAAGCRMVEASIYGKETCKFNPDPRCPTASGILHFDGSQLIVAHRSLPFHTKVRVTFRGKSITVPVEDRGPAKWTGRTIDLSKATAHRIGFDQVGIGKVCMEVLR